MARRRSNRPGRCGGGRAGGHRLGLPGDHVADERLEFAADRRAPAGLAEHRFEDEAGGGEGLADQQPLFLGAERQAAAGEQFGLGDAPAGFGVHEQPSQSNTTPCGVQDPNTAAAAGTVAGWPVTVGRPAGAATR
ncbi:hypothetical protein ACQP00_28730 [Dactylosporangium sp. CS-047395]|uniref:hypothetical protein n=1 Tax=Dactylosporangium sp. CS-047395 TaxID=3239936 RepID=UPI003D948678